MKWGDQIIMLRLMLNWIIIYRRFAWYIRKIQPPVRRRVKKPVESNHVITINGTNTIQVYIVFSDAFNLTLSQSFLISNSNVQTDTECLKMDLHEEKVREDLIHQKETQRKLIEVLPTTNEILIDQLTDVEKKSIADRYSIVYQFWYLNSKLIISSFVDIVSRAMNFSEAPNMTWPSPNTQKVWNIS